ncbi:SOS response-associated peptidase family protein [Pseudomonas sp. GCM10022188]|uniref:SOS response-associated peptidase family protein n=1 Tax=Pseudomonas TaxID=286 RepID=UPI001E4BD9CD|nr:SOS response-associated peptidase family protein [Pseudomonas oryzagri]MCC6074680.1 SOS response-associated peptidase [Pseudomonas oryzagri]
MCGRFALFRWSPALAALPGFPPRHEPRWNIAPGQQVLLVRASGQGREAGLVHWGLTPAWLADLSRAPAQARAETLAVQPLFREAFARRRGVLPANGFYEWRGPRRRPYWMSVAEQPQLGLAALWESYPVGERTYLSAAVVTVAAGAQRRPLLLDAAAEALWLDPQAPVEQLQALLAAPALPLRERLLAGLGNRPGEEGPQCLTPA